MDFFTTMLVNLKENSLRKRVRDSRTFQRAVFYVDPLRFLSTFASMSVNTLTLELTRSRNSSYSCNA